VYVWVSRYALLHDFSMCVFVHVMNYRAFFDAPANQSQPFQKNQATAHQHTHPPHTQQHNHEGKKEAHITHAYSS
jgi:hypothetical protein